MSSSNWLEVLQQEVDTHGLSRVAQKLNMSKATVSQVLKGKYNASTQTIEQKVNGAFMAKEVCCPIIGDIPINVCLDHQSRKFAATNHIRVQLYKACRGDCPHSRIGK
ncbi:transcriptional regulator [Pseudoalteromonas sp. CO325X]|uniref:helix-turn-helix domain-containing protein n=1 Tax=Pseudoalteromonas sp. CO325X TaxID=1777262 RepID=UPI001023648B|nr:helix-turn-helix transcriptional regulator [Pseudoalteromonas sp. CO325X]RZF83736.1 transcriptional regulator [Pseudoalteromonas sp. CO325X]